jgi:uncharacterized membrane protein
MFTDAAVAIALTLLVLPLVEAAADEHLVLADHVAAFGMFVLSFFVVAVYWRIHHVLFDMLQRFDETLLTLNTCWLLGVVLLPVPTALLVNESVDGTTATLIYLVNLLFVGLMGLAMARWIVRHPGLARPGMGQDLAGFTRRALVVSAVIVVAIAATFLLSRFALILLAALPLAQRLVSRRSHAAA